VLANANSDAISFATLLNCAGCTIVTCDGHQLTATLVDYPMGGTPHSAEANGVKECPNSRSASGVYSRTRLRPRAYGVSARRGVSDGPCKEILGTESVPKTP
jgi:hypothetical protein